MDRRPGRGTAPCRGPPGRHRPAGGRARRERAARPGRSRRPVRLVGQPADRACRSSDLLRASGRALDASGIAERWLDGGPDAHPCAPIGVAADGIVDLDLVRDGPHGLVAGTTGSGKSELLRSLVAGMAATRAAGPADASSSSTTRAGRRSTRAPSLPARRRRGHRPRRAPRRRGRCAACTPSCAGARRCCAPTAPPTSRRCAATAPGRWCSPGSWW